MLRINFLQFFFVTLLVLSVVFAADQLEDVTPRESLQEALADIKATSFHDALHALSAKFRHGIFPTDLHAAEALQGEEPAIATLIRLAKRQNNATASPETTTSVAGVTTSQAVTEPTTSEANPTTSASTGEPTTSAQPTTTAEPTTSASSSSSTTTRSVSSDTTTTEPTTTASVPSTTQSAQTTHSTTTSVPSTLTTAASTSSSSSSTTNGHSTTSTTHTTQNTSSYTSTYKSTTTMADGSVSTITSITIVHPTATGSSEGSGSTARPGLQTGGASRTTDLTREVVAIIGGAVMVAMVL
jgi:hypothetical protein